MVLPPEAWTALGVAIGGAATAFFAWLGRFGEMRSQRQKSKIDYQQSQITALKDEIAALKADMRNIESEARKERAEAYSIQDRARLALSMAASHISLLNAHILARGHRRPRRFLMSCLAILRCFFGQHQLIVSRRGLRLLVSPRQSKNKKGCEFYSYPFAFRKERRGYGVQLCDG